jgi:UDPglucose--hexose-1-phosphate uridylyltransferase
MAMPEWRKDPVTGLWLIIAPERAQRPQGEQTIERCPFCAGHEVDTPPEVFSIRAVASSPNTPGWDVRVVPNQYPAVVNRAGAVPAPEPFYLSMPAQGAHEVVIESPDHLENIASLEQYQLLKILTAYRQRMRELSKDERWRYLLLFKNQGIGAGATLAHVHSQLMGLTIIPSEAEREIDGAQDYYNRTGSCVYCEMNALEVSAGKRIVDANQDFLTFCPYASRVAYESWIVPRHHESLFTTSDDASVHNLARPLSHLLRRLDRALGGLQCNYVIHSGPPHLGDNPFYHWHMEVLPRVVQQGGFEWGSGSYINVVRPEDAAALLRGVDPN